MELSHEELRNILSLWDIGTVQELRLINISENRTYLVDASEKFILRQHRNGYHTKIEIESELSWAQSLFDDHIITTPIARAGKNGELVQEVAGTHFALFDFIEGETPSENDNLVPKFKNLGGIAARTHLHSLSWRRPRGFIRKSWDLDTILGQDPFWGRWQDGPNVTPEVAEVLDQAEKQVRSALTNYGKDKERFGLIHADMRLANLLVQDDDLRLIDFDDCGFGWFLFDFAAAVSFIETDPQLPDLLNAWLAGFEELRALDDQDRAIIPSLVILRRLQLLAWIGSHMEATEPTALAPFFARETVGLAEEFLAGRFLS